MCSSYVLTNTKIVLSHTSIIAFDLILKIFFAQIPNMRWTSVGIESMLDHTFEFAGHADINLKLIPVNFFSFVFRNKRLF